MGQRLVIHIKKDDKVIGNCYYHWSAYTRSALELVYDIIKNYNSRLSNVKLDDDIFALRCFSMSDKDGLDTKSQAGLSEDSLKNMQKKYPHLDDWALPKVVDRNEGIIGTTKRDMDNSKDNEEGAVYIDFTNKVIDFEVYSYYGSVDAWKEEMEEIHGEKIDATSLPTSPYDVETFNFIEIEDMMEFFESLIGKSVGYYFLDGKGEVCGMIE